MPSESSQPEKRQRVQRTTGHAGSERAAVKPHKRGTEPAATPQATQHQASAAVKPTASSANAQASTAQTAAPAQQGTIDISKLLTAWAQSLGGTQLAQTYVGSTLPKKEALARKQFGIPNAETVILVLDATIFGTCKAGFALCSKGLYLRDTAGKARTLSWAEFVRGTLAADAQNLVIDGSRIVTIDAAPLGNLLASIKKAIAG